MATPSRVTRIVVSAADIAAGARESYESCPLALAIKRHTGATWARVDPSLGRITFGLDAGGGTGWEARATLPPRMVTWVDAFDDGAEVAPTYLQMVWHDEIHR